MRLTGATIVAVSLLVACSTAPGVEVEYRADSSSQAESTTTTAAATTTTTTTTPPPPTTDPVTATTVPPDPPLTEADRESVLFELSEFDIEVTLRPTSAPTPPGGYDGFHTVVQLDDGSFMASGYDAAGDGVQPERSALWRSADGRSWDRVGVREVSAQPDQQVINSLVVANGAVRAIGMLLDTTGSELRSGGIGRWTTADGGDSWIEFPTVDFATARRGSRIDRRFVTVGGGNVNEPGAFYGLVTTEGNDQVVRSTAVDVDEVGDPRPGSDVHDVVDLSDEWLAVGSTTLTDPGRLGSESYFDSENPDFPSDVAVWSSLDAGASWTRLDISRFAGEAGTQAAIQVTDDGARLWMLVRAQKFGVFALDLLTSTDGRSWDLHPYRRPIEPSAGDLANAYGVYFVEGAIVVIDEVIRAGAPSLVMSVIDPATDEIVSHDLTEQLGGVHQIEDLVQLDGFALGVGRVERGADTSDLQSIEVRRIEPDDALEPAPTTTTPSSGGGSSDA